MATSMYLIYDIETGDVVHLHVEEAGLDTRLDEVLQVAGVAGDKRYGVLDVSGQRPPARAFRVEDGGIRELDVDGDTGMAAAMPGFAEPFAERRYEHEPPRSPSWR